jgi:hypothetical protein
VERTDQWVRANKRSVSLTSAAPVAFQDGVFVLGSDEEITPFDQPFDLENSTLDFVRKDARSFSVTAGSLNYDGDVGALLKNFAYDSSNPDWFYVPYDLTRFEFPFYSRSVRRLYLSSYRPIHFSPPPTIERTGQDGPLSAISQTNPMIAPAVQPVSSSVILSASLCQGNGDALTITWRRRVQTYFVYDIQAVLFRNGDIRFSYRTMTNMPWGSVVITNGEEERRSTRQTLKTETDPAGDLQPVFPALRQAADIQSVRIDRLAESDLIEFSIQTSAPLNRNALGSRSVAYEVRVAPSNAFAAAARVFATHVEYSVGGWSVMVDSPAVTIDGSVVTLRVLQSMLPLPSDRSHPADLRRHVRRRHGLGQRAPRSAGRDGEPRSAVIARHDPRTADSGERHASHSQSISRLGESQSDVLASRRRGGRRSDLPGLSHRHQLLRVRLLDRPARRAVDDTSPSGRLRVSVLDDSHRCGGLSRISLRKCPVLGYAPLHAESGIVAVRLLRRVGLRLLGRPAGGADPAQRRDLDGRRARLDRAGGRHPRWPVRRRGR